MKNIIILALLLVGCAPVKYVYIDPKDTSKLVEVRKRIIYEDVYMPSYFDLSWGFPRYYGQPRMMINIPNRPVRVQRRR
jgi:hypothetical protein